jgi:hypothetical protein
MSDLISGYILPVLLKLDTEALVGRSMQARTKTFHDFSGQNLMVG